MFRKKLHFERSIEAADITKDSIEQGVNDFVIVNSAWHDDEINYAGPAIYE